MSQLLILLCNDFQLDRKCYQDKHIRIFNIFVIYDTFSWVLEICNFFFFEELVISGVFSEHKQQIKK